MKKLTTDEFIKKSKNIYNNLYDYSNVVYINNKTEVDIFCNTCDSYFKQTPNKHLSKKKINCKCSNKLNTEKFIERSKSIHKNLFSYENVNYINSYTKVEIICNTCNLRFKQMPHNHLNGNKCPNCFGTHKRTNEDFVKKSMDIHGIKYDYSNVEYKNNNTKVKIICNTCNNTFYQIPIDHLNGHGCSSCCSGFKYNKPAILYYIKIKHENKSYYKIGITNRTVDKRFSFEIDKITIINIKKYKDGLCAYNDEREILEKYKEYKYSGEPILKSGNTEIFTK